VILCVCFSYEVWHDLAWFGLIWRMDGMGWDGTAAAGIEILFIM